MIRYDNQSVKKSSIATDPNLVFEPLMTDLCLYCYGLLYDDKSLVQIIANLDKKNCYVTVGRNSVKFINKPRGNPPTKVTHKQNFNVKKSVRV